MSFTIRLPSIRCWRRTGVTCKRSRAKQGAPARHAGHAEGLAPKLDSVMTLILRANGMNVRPAKKYADHCTRLFAVIRDCYLGIGVSAVGCRFVRGCVVAGHGDRRCRDAGAEIRASNGARPRTPPHPRWARPARGDRKAVLSTESAWQQIRPPRRATV
jgi:hypothetical protein